MLLAKSCKKEDNLITRKTIKLGTLFEYRSIESAQIVDKDEGKFIYNIIIDKETEISRPWFHMLFPYFGFDDDYKFDRPIMGSSMPDVIARNVCYKLKEGQPGIVVVKQTVAEVTDHAANCFIFCMSLVRKTYQTQGMFPNYDDCWYIESFKAEHFMLVLGDALRKKIATSRAAGVDIIPKHIDLDRIKILAKRSQVTYIPRDITITDHADLVIEEFMQRLRNLNYVKPPRFSHELEYRIAFMITLDDRVVEPLVENVILDVPQLAPLAFSV